VLLIGATGLLGSEICKAILAREDLSLRALRRPGKPEADAELASLGIEVFHGDVLDPQSLQPAMTGVNVVVCALPNDPRSFVPGHRNLLQAAENAGVSRFVPSDFAIDFFKLDSDENFNLAMRKEVAPLYERRRVRPIHILNGAFMDTLLDPRSRFIDWERGTVRYFGDGKQACDFTSVADTAQYVAYVCADPEAPEVLRVAGDVLTIPEFAAAVSRGTGKTIEALPAGTVDDLKRLIAEKQSAGGNPWDWIPLQYVHNMVSGRAKLDAIDNDRYPEVRPETLEQFACRTGIAGAHGMSHTDH
jgi:nucleoside-diphosphate-sugar epimerase